MNYQGILKVAKDKFGQDSNIVKEIEARISSGSTGGEIIGMVGKYLKDLENIDTTTYIILKKEIERYLSECKKHGLIIE